MPPDLAELTRLRSKVAELEQQLGVGRKDTLAQQAVTAGEARQKALQVPVTDKSREVAAGIRALADKHNVVIDWGVQEVIPTALQAGMSCCCCCCCCR